MRNYKKIKAYQFADQLAIEIYKYTRHFPKEELYGLTSQLRRAGLSIATNIVEGTSRQHYRDYIQFLYISRGSLAEVEYLLHFSYKMNYLNHNSFKKIDEKRKITARTLFGLINSVKQDMLLKCKRN